MFHVYIQNDARDCGVSCLRMICRHHGQRFSERELSELCHTTRNGVSLRDISEAAEKIGMKTMGVRLTIDRLAEDIPLPCILHWNQHHFVVCYKVRRKRGNTYYYIADPASKCLKYSEEELKQCWGHSEGNRHYGIALLLQPTDRFYSYEPRKQDGSSGLKFLARYFKRFRKSLTGIFIAMLLISALQLIAPFLTQRMVDVGIGQRDMNMITLMLIAQMTVFVSSLVVGIVRNRMALFMNMRVNITIVSEFLSKLMRMPFRFFDIRLMGDINQRIRDNDRIEDFLTGSSVETLFSMVSFVVFASILAYYNVIILLVFCVGNAMYVGWTQFFMRRRRDLDLKRFNQLADEQDIIYQMIGGVREIKLNNCEDSKIEEWKDLQTRLFQTKLKTLNIFQWQQFGSVFFSQTTSLIITYMAAREVVEGRMTLGMMMSVSYIIGQISAPVSNFVLFLSSLQYARLSLERISEIQEAEDEDQCIQRCQAAAVPEDMTVSLRGVWFSYSGADRNYALQNVNLVIPQHKITAVVGASGCGKTTILKLLLGFYTPNKGGIYVGGVPMTDINPHLMRQRMGSVLQDGFVFSDDIRHNVALGEKNPDMDKVRVACRVACIDDFVMHMPLGYDTKVGMEGNGLSQGQKQRLLIARAVYKNPDILVLDEATNALDAKTERMILENMQVFYRNRTVVVAAHRLSTIRNADNIVVIADGRVVEQGTHEELLKKKGEYWTLLSCQIE